MLRRLLKSARPGLFARLGVDRRGVSALEFALLAPIMILIYFGMAELSEAMMAQRRVSHATSSMGDLIAQFDSQNSPVKNTDMANVFAAANAIMDPFPTTQLSLRVSSVVVQSDGSTKVAWSDAQGTGLPAYAAGAPITLPSSSSGGTSTPLISAVGDSVIMAESKYSYSSPVNYLLPNGLTFNEIFYLKPRKTPTVTRDRTS